jgi:hypothetical protein
MDKSLAENLYYKEEERKAELLNLLNIVLAILGLALGLLAFYINASLTNVNAGAQQSSLCLLSYAGFVIFLVLDFLAIAASVYYIIRAFHNHTYQYLPSAKALSEYWVGLLAHYQGQAGGGGQPQAQQDYDAYLTQQFIDAADRNDGLNQRRKMYLHLATRYCIVSITLLGLTFIPFVFTGKSDDTSTRIVGFDAPLSVEITSRESTTNQCKEKTNAGERPVQPKRSEQQSIKPEQQSAVTTAQATAATAPTNQGERGQSINPQDGVTK